MNASLRRWGNPVARYRLRLLLQEFDLPPGETLLGRSPECHITIDDPLVSREHAKIIVQDDTVILRDLGSRNGCKINGQPLRGDVTLSDGDRLRIGNQEIVFTRVIAPRRPGRPTGSLRHCRQCQSPYMVEAPICPHCGYGSGAEVTLSGTAPSGNLDRDAWSLQMQLELLEKALSLTRLMDGDRVLGRIAVAIDERLSAQMSIDSEQLDHVFVSAVRLASAQGEAQWIRWVLSTLLRLERLPALVVVEQLERVPPIVLDTALERLSEAVDAWQERLPSYDVDGSSAIDRLAELRERLSARRVAAGPSSSPAPWSKGTPGSRSS